MAESEKEKALQTALAQIEKQFGKGAVMKLGQNSSLNVEAIPTGPSRWISRWASAASRGEESSRSTARKVPVKPPLPCTSWPKPRRWAAKRCSSTSSTRWTRSTRRRWASISTRFWFPSRTPANRRWKSARRWCVPVVVVVDSVAAMTTKAEIEGEMGDSFVGLQARLMSQALRKLTGAISKSNAVCIFINQLREKIGVMYGNPETTPGGRALKFYSSVRLDVRKKDPIKEGGEIIGNLTRVKVVKNKVAPPFREAEFDIMYGEGISREGEIIDLAVKLDIIKKSGSWYSYEGNRIGQGRDKVKQYLKENPDVREQIAKQVMDQKDQLLAPSKAKKKEDVADKPAASQPEETVVPMREASSSIPDLDEDFGSQKSSSSLIDIEADDK